MTTPSLIRILLVDDHSVLRAGLRMLLNSQAHLQVVGEAGDGREALQIFQGTAAIAFVILDLTMPRMDGEQCFCELRKLRPDVQVIISSGYSEQEVTHKFAGQGLAGFIQKPYNLGALRGVTRSLIPHPP